MYRCSGLVGAWRRTSKVASQIELQTRRSLILLPQRTDAASTAALAEAGIGSTIAIAVAGGAGLTAFLLWQNRLGKGGSITGPVEILNPSDFAYVSEVGLSSVLCRHCGSPVISEWSGATLRLRTDDHSLLAGDAAATALLGGRFSAGASLVFLESASVAQLNDSFRASRGPSVRCLDKSGKVVFGLRTPAVGLAPGDHDGPEIVVELRPQSGVAERFGMPTAFNMRQRVRVHYGELDKPSEYNPEDLFSGRAPRIKRAIAALGSNPRDVLSVNADGVMQDIDGGWKNFQDALKPLGLDSVDPLLQAVGTMLSSSDGLDLLGALLRAQCSAAGGTAQLARKLYDVLQQKAPKAVDDLASSSALEAALVKGFWTLPGDESGLRQREREGERLLERANRELWLAGSTSRQELEHQGRHFLTRYLLGSAALQARLRLRFVRLSSAPGAAARLETLHYVPVSNGLWCRLELASLELPPVENIAEEAGKRDRLVSEYLEATGRPQSPEMSGPAWTGRGGIVGAGK